MIASSRCSRHLRTTGWTWEILLLPVGKDAGKGIASMKIQTPVRRRACTATGAPQGGHEPRQATALRNRDLRAGWESSYGLHLDIYYG